MSFNQSPNQFTIQRIVGQTTMSPNLNILDVQFARPDAWSAQTDYNGAGFGTDFPVYNLFDRKTYKVATATGNINKRPDLFPGDWTDTSGEPEFKTFVPGTPMMFASAGNPDILAVKLQDFSSEPNLKLAAGVVIHDTKRQNRGIISSNSETSFRIASRGSVVYLRSVDNVALRARGSLVGYSPTSNPNLTTDPRISLYVPTDLTDSPVGITLDEIPLTNSGGTIVRVLIMIPIIPKFGT